MNAYVIFYGAVICLHLWVLFKMYDGLDNKQPGAVPWTLAQNLRAGLWGYVYALLGVLVTWIVQVSLQEKTPLVPGFNECAVYCTMFFSFVLLLGIALLSIKAIGRALSFGWPPNERRY